MRSIDAGATSAAELVAQVTALAAELAARPAPASGAACYEQVQALGRAVDLIESAIATRVGVATRQGQVAEWGHASPIAWLRTSLEMRRARAEERAVLATQLPRLPQVAKRLAAGELSMGYATAIAAGVRRLDEADCGKAEDLLLGFVDDGHSVTQITRFADKINDLIADRDDTATEPQDGRRAERQWWTLHRSGSGTFVKGHFGAELTALIKAKLEPLASPCGPDDTRDHAERLADALQTHLSGGDSRWDPILLINLTQTKQARPDTRGPDTHRPAAVQTGPGSVTAAAATAGRRPQPMAVGDPVEERHTTATGNSRTAPTPPAAPRPSTTAPDSTAGAQPPEHAEPDATAKAAAEIRRRSGPPGTTESGTAQPAGCGAEPEQTTRWVPAPPTPTWPFDGTPFTARLTDGTPIPTERARSILLNAGFSTLILGTDGHPLYLGRRVRCATPAQRRVLLTRYATCVVDGCEIPATRCQIDHIDGWENGQPTDIDRLVMCCAFHNRYKWRRPDRITITHRPDGRYTYQIHRPTTNQYARIRDRPTSRPSDRGP